MAPTEILAAQHDEGITEVCCNLGITIELLTGSTTRKEKERMGGKKAEEHTGGI